MKGKRWIAGGIVFVILFTLNLGTIFIFYRHYSENINQINQQNWLAKVKLEAIEKNAELFKAAIDTVTSQVKNYDESILNLDKRVNQGELGSKDMQSKIASMKLDVEDWQKKYTSTIAQLADIKVRTDALMASVDQVKRAAGGNVDLGQISVQGEIQTAPDNISAE